MDFKTTKAEVTLQHINYALGLNSDIDVFSFGPDGALGGEGNDADIGSWNL
jgi:hypothetical protein